MNSKQIINIVAITCAIFFLLSDNCSKLYRAYKTRDMKAYSYSYLFIELIAFILMESFLIGLLFQWIKNFNTYSPSDSNYIPLSSIVTQFADVVASAIQIFVVLILLLYKILKKDEFAANKYFKSLFADKKNILIFGLVSILVSVLVITVVVLQIYILKKHGFNNTTWIDIFSILTTVLLITANGPQVIRTIITRDTHALSLLALFSYACAELSWFGYDFTQFLTSKEMELLPELIEDATLIALTIPVIIIKFINLKKDSSTSINDKTSFKKINK